MPSVTINHSEVIEYWFSEKSRKHWFSSTPEIDNEIKQRYEKLWINAASGKLNDWQDSPQGCLALIIILDQFPLNMFRGKAKSFQTEKLAVEVALKAIDNGYDEILNTEELQSNTVDNSDDNSDVVENDVEVENNNTDEISDHDSSNDIEAVSYTHLTLPTKA